MFVKKVILTMTLGLFCMGAESITEAQLIELLSKPGAPKQVAEQYIVPNATNPISPQAAKAIVRTFQLNSRQFGTVRASLTPYFPELAAPSVARTPEEERAARTLQSIYRKRLARKKDAARLREISEARKADLKHVRQETIRGMELKGEPKGAISDKLISMGLGPLVAKKPGKGGARSRSRSRSPSRGGPAAPLHSAREDWLRDALLVGSDRSAVVGFGVADRLDAFNPLYSKSFPKTPVIHQYNPLTSPNGGLFPLVVKFPSDGFLSSLPPHVQKGFNVDKIKPEQCDLFWTVQNKGSISAKGEGVGDQVIYRLQYWAIPSGASGAFTAGGIILDEGRQYPLAAVGYSIHDGVASPNAPVIPIAPKLLGEKSSSFWSFAQHGARMAITYHWILSGNDNTVLGAVIDKSGSLREVLLGLRGRRAYFTSPKMINELDFLDR